MLETYGFKGPKHDQGTRKLGTTQPFKKFIGNSVTSKNGNAAAETTATQEFIDDHEINRVADANGNDDKLFKASNIEPLDRKKEKHGYDAKDAENVNEKKLTPAEMKKREEVAKAIERDNPTMPMSKKMAIATSTAKKVADDVQYESILDAVNAHKQIQEEQELVDAYAAILESIYESLDTDEQREHFSEMLESEDAFDDLVELVESVIAEENE
jgi:hypothetical protein